MNGNKKEIKQVRQGDILLVRVQSLPAGLAVKDNILAIGEITGHSHRLIGRQVQVFKDKEGNQWIDCGDGTVLEHEEHAHEKIPEGKYQLRQAREFTMSQAVRQVMD